MSLLCPDLTLTNGRYTFAANRSPVRWRCLPGAPDPPATDEGARMLRRWCIPITTTILAFGSMLAASGNASASVIAHAPAPLMSHALRPGGPMLQPAGAHALVSRGGRTTDESTNWSGYAATGGTG